MWEVENANIPTMKGLTENGTHVFINSDTQSGYDSVYLKSYLQLATLRSEIGLFLAIPEQYPLPLCTGSLKLIKNIGQLDRTKII